MPTTTYYHYMNSICAVLILRLTPRSPRWWTQQGRSTCWPQCNTPTLDIWLSRPTHPTAGLLHSRWMQKQKVISGLTALFCFFVYRWVRGGKCTNMVKLRLFNFSCFSITKISWITWIYVLNRFYCHQFSRNSFLVCYQEIIVCTVYLFANPFSVWSQTQVSQIWVELSL